MKKVKLFVCADMTVIDCGEEPTKNFGGYSYYEVIANVVSIEEKGDVYIVITDFCNPYRSVCSKFLLFKEYFDKIKWVE